MAKLTRGERFKDARNVHNQHKKQTMDEVSAATGLNKSLIQSLEDDSVNRSVGYDKVVKLAAHYGVTTDFLLGLSNDPSIHPAATNDLHISAKAIQQIKLFTIHEKQAEELSSLMEDRLFWSIMREIIAYKKASIAEGIYDSISFMHYTSDEDSCMAESIAQGKIEEELSAAINDVTLDDDIRRYLSSLVYLKSLPGSDSCYSDDAYVLNFVPSEIHEQRARSYLSAILERVNPESPSHNLRRIYTEVATSGHIHYDQNGNAHYSPKRRKDDE